MLESAIPPHLRLPRTQPPRIPSADFQPPNAAYTARFPQSVSHLVMATICAQARDPHTTLCATEVLAPVLECLKRGGGGGGVDAGGSDGASIAGDSGSGSGSDGGATDDDDDDDEDAAAAPFDLISFRDVAGVHNVGVVAYRAGGRAGWERWAEASGLEAWWSRVDPQAEPVGWFREVFFPSADRCETLFSSGEAGREGAARLGAGLSGAVREHVYWGSMRDRMPAAQVDGLAGEGVAARGKGGTEGRRVVIPGKRNLCVIRSGQDWSAMAPEERTLYLETMHPVLVKGMDFLRDEGRAVGCHSCRFVEELDPRDAARDTERTFGFAFFRDMEALEKWSKSHRTHLEIFGRFLQYVKELDGNVSLRLFHEVLALTPEQQLLEYVGCHPRTGLVGV